MLVLALGATLVGFVLLVGALFSGLLWLAIACIVVCVIGVGFLIADLLGIGRPAGESRSGGDGARTSHSDDGADDDAGPESTEEPERRSDSDSEVTGRIPRVSRHERDDDPPTEEIRLDHPS